jgi:hypothetical protein
MLLSEAKTRRGVSDMNEPRTARQAASRLRYRHSMVLTCLGSCSMLAVGPFASPSLAQTTTTPPTSAPEPIVQLRGSGALAFLLIVGLALIAMWLVPVLLDAGRAYRLRRDVIEFLRNDAMTKVAAEGLTLDELKALLATISEPAIGQRALARMLMALSITTVVGILAFALMLSSAPDASDLRKTALTALLSVLGVVVGFYFGSRSVESAMSGTPQAASGGVTTTPVVRTPVLRVVEPTQPASLSRDATGAWQPVPIRLQYPPGETVTPRIVAGDERGQVEETAPGSFEYRPAAPTGPNVTIQFSLGSRPEITEELRLQVP